MVVDAAGNAITGFLYRGPADASDRSLPWNGRPGDLHLGIAKYRPDGGLAWVRGFAPDAAPGVATHLGLQALTVDTRGDVLIGGSAEPTASIDGTPVRGTFLAKLDRDTGRVLWARSTRPAADTDFVFQDFEADSQGDFVALASFTRFVGGIATPPEMMVIKYRGSDSEPLWDRIWPQPAPVGPDNTAGGRAGFILALTPSGSFRWNRDIQGDFGYLVVTSISAARSRVLVTASGMLDFQGTSRGGGSFVMGYYSEDGGERWVQRLSSHFSRGIVRAVGEEAVVVSGSDASLFGNPRQHPTQSHVHYQTFFVAKFWRTSGRYLGSRNVEQVTSEALGLWAHSIAMSPVDGEVAVAGRFGGKTDFGTGAPVTPRGSNDTFLLRLKH